MNTTATFRQNPVNQLLNTAAAATGIVDDVDGLLHPMEKSPEHSTNSTTSSTRLPTQESRPERNLWRTDEIMEMLKVMQEINAMEMLNDKTIKSEKVFLNVEELMNKRGFNRKSHVQIWTKWKFLKSTYMTSKRNCVIPKMIPYAVYEVLGKMLSGGSSDCENSIASYDGDNSNGGTSVTGSDGKHKSKIAGASVANELEDENGFGMAHPIFGFRLGMVKTEPADLGKNI